MVPGGMRIGTPALTTRGLKEEEFVQVADFIDRAVKIAKDCQAKTPAPGDCQCLDAVVVLCLSATFTVCGAAGDMVAALTGR
jgi:glycine/serine hydroxymethyltransferase